MKSKYFFGLLLSLPLGQLIYGQASTVSGTVVDKTNSKTVEFATVQLLQLPDSALVKSMVTDQRGKFLFDNINDGKYLLRFSFISYAKAELPLQVNPGQSKVNVGVIEMTPVSGSLQQVVVISKKSLLNASIDRKIYDVTQDIMSQTGSASDLLRNIPSVEVDVEGQVTLRGSPDVMILINGRPSPLMGRTQAEALQQLPANAIERIEVITNPSSKYRPDGTSGIINIILKKNTRFGLNGTAVANVGNRNRYNGNLSLNYKTGKFNLYSNYSIRKDTRIRVNDVNRTYIDSSQKITGYYFLDGESKGRPLSQTLTLGTDLLANDQNSFGLSLTYFDRDMVRNDKVQNNFTDPNGIPTLHYDRLRYDPEPEYEKNITSYWQHRFKKEDHELRFEFNASKAQDHENNYYTNYYYVPTQSPSYDNTFVLEGENQQQLTIDYSNPLSENSKLEAGYAGLFTQQDLNLYAEYFDTSRAEFVKDINKSNQFLYREYIHAFYGLYQRSYGQFSYSAGLRAEQAYIKGNLVTKDSLINNNYFKIYPTLHLSYKLTNGELQLNYSKRVNRPDAQDLNPFPDYQDPRNLRAGNPALKPEIIHSIEFGYKWQGEKVSLIPSIYYRYKENGFTNVIIPIDDSTLLSTMVNLSNDQSAGLEFILSAKAGKLLTANLSTNIFYNQIDATELGFEENKSIISMGANLNTNFTITKNTVAQLSCNYRSARLTPQGKVYPTFVMNLGLRQDLFNKKLSLIFTASDLLSTLRQKTVINTAFLQQTSINRRDGLAVYFGLSYRFGKALKKTNEENLQFDNNMQ